MQEQLPSVGLALSLCLGILVSGCHHGRLEPRSANPTAPVLSADELFEIARFHAHHGDLLRAEQYLSAARAGGYDEAEVVYWLVRVCISAGRYRSALLHAGDYLRRYPKNWGLRLVVASLYEALEDPARARIELEAIVRAEPARALPRYSLGKLYMRERSTRQGAMVHLEAYLELEPNGLHAPEAQAMLVEARIAERPISPSEPLGAGGPSQ